MLEIAVRDEKNSDIKLSHDITSKEAVADIVQKYAVYVKTASGNHIMHVHIDSGINIPFEQMFQIYLGVRHVHNTFKIVEEVNVYLVDSLTVRCFRTLLNLVSPTVRVIVHTIPVSS